MRRVLMSLAALVGLVTVGLAAVPASVAGAQSGTTPVVVTSADLVSTTPGPGQFVVENNGDGTGAVSDVTTGPDASQGSLQLSTTGSGSHWSVFTDDQSGTALANITTLSYSSLTNDTSNTYDPSLQLVIDPGNTSSGPDQGVTYSTLNFEPYLQTAGVTNGEWQNWNVLDGVVWGTHLTGAPNGAPIPWSTFISDYPNATILPVADGGGAGFNVGSDWSAVVGNVADFTIGTSSATTEYIFDPTAPTTTTTTAPSVSNVVLGSTASDSATVTGNADVGSPTGSVQFYECGPTTSATPCTSTSHKVGSAVSVTASANDTSTASSASFTPTAAGTWCFAGVYSGDSNYAGSSDTTTDECFTVTAASSSTTTVPQSTTMVYGSTNYDTATVTGDAGGSPTGTVAFYECGPVPNPTPCTSTANLVSEAELTAGPSDTATAHSVGFTPTSSGYWCFAGDYLGSSNYQASADATTDECFDVSLAPTKVTTAPIDSSIQLGQKVNDQATVTDTQPGGTPDSTVSFYVCGPTSAAAKCTSTADRVGSPVSVTEGSGSSSTATSMAFKPTAVGDWCFFAKYAGDTSYAASSDSSTNECVNVEGPLSFVTTSLPSGTANKYYSTTLVARGGTKPYTWRTLGSVKLPYGLEINKSTGVISGTTKQSGTFSIEFQVADSSKPIEYASKTLKLVIAS
jgi:hypothetical protein